MWYYWLRLKLVTTKIRGMFSWTGGTICMVILRLQPKSTPRFFVQRNSLAPNPNSSSNTAVGSVPSRSCQPYAEAEVRLTRVPRDRVALKLFVDASRGASIISEKNSFSIYNEGLHRNIRYSLYYFIQVLMQQWT